MAHDETIGNPDEVLPKYRVELEHGGCLVDVYGHPQFSGGSLAFFSGSRLLCAWGPTAWVYVEQRED